MISIDNFLKGSIVERDYKVVKAFCDGKRVEQIAEENCISERHAYRIKQRYESLTKNVMTNPVTPRD